MKLVFPTVRGSLDVREWASQQRQTATSGHTRGPLLDHPGFAFFPHLRIAATLSFGGGGGEEEVQWWSSGSLRTPKSPSHRADSAHQPLPKPQSLHLSSLSSLQDPAKSFLQTASDSSGHSVLSPS